MKSLYPSQDIIISILLITRDHKCGSLSNRQKSKMGDEFNACLERKPDYANKKAEPCSASVDPEGPDSYRENPRLKHKSSFRL